MIRDGRREFGEALAARRSGAECPAGPATPFDELKPDFYADSWGLSENVLDEWENLTAKNPPLGLVGRQGEPIKAFEHSDPWMQLELGLMSTISRAINQADSPIEDCPYHQVLSEKLTPRRMVGHDLDDERGLGVFRGVYAPGGLAAPALIAGLLRRTEAIRDYHGATKPSEQLAKDSARSLLRAPLAHSQQHARAFMFAIADSMDGTEYGISRTGLCPTRSLRPIRRLLRILRKVK